MSVPPDCDAVFLARTAHHATPTFDMQFFVTQGDGKPAVHAGHRKPYLRARQLVPDPDRRSRTPRQAFSTTHIKMKTPTDTQRIRFLDNRFIVA